MPTAYDSASQDIENQRRAAVAALAASGTQGAAALADANSNVATMREAALRTELARTAGRQMGGIQGAGLAELRGMIARPYDMIGASIAAQQGSHGARLAAVQGASDNYFRQLAAAVPLAQQNMLAKLTLIKAEEEREARERAAREDELSDSELRARLLGAGDELRSEALGIARGDRDAARSQLGSLRTALADARYGPGPGPAGPLGPQGPHGTVRPASQRRAIELIKTAIAQTKERIGASKESIGGVKARSSEAYGRDAGLAAGLDPARVRGLLRLPSPDEADVKPSARVLAITEAAQRANIPSKRLGKMTELSFTNDEGESQSWYQVAVDEAENAIKEGVPFDTFKKDLNFYLPKKLKRIKALVLAQYRPAFER